MLRAKVQLVPSNTLCKQYDGYSTRLKRPFKSPKHVGRSVQVTESRDEVKLHYTAMTGMRANDIPVHIKY